MASRVPRQVRPELRLVPELEPIPPPAPRPTRRRSFAAAAPRMLAQLRDVRAARAAAAAPATLPLLSIETLVDCNARCGMCGYPSDYPAGGRPLTTAELYRIVDEAAELGALVVSLGGGEPFLRPDTEAVIQHIDARGITPFVHSNGSQLTPSRCDRLADNSGLVLALSLDSNKRAVHDALRRLACFDSLIAGARHFVRHARHVRVLFTFTITAVNFRDMTATMRLARDLGVRTVRFTPLHENLQHRFRDRVELAPFCIAERHLPELADEIERTIAFARRHGMITNSRQFLRAIPDYLRGPVPHRCYAGFFFCSVDPFGNLFPCYDHQGGTNVRDGGLTAALRSPEMQALRRRVLDCSHRCWNVGTAEPSLRMDLPSLAAQLPQLVRETLFFLP